MSPHHDPPPPPRKTRVLTAIAVTALVIAFVLLHLTGVIGPGTH